MMQLLTDCEGMSYIEWKMTCQVRRQGVHVIPDRPTKP